MKEIRMDWDTYQSDLNAKYDQGHNAGVRSVVNYLKSGETMFYYLEGDIGYAWRDLAVALGRESELKPKE